MLQSGRALSMLLANEISQHSHISAHAALELDRWLGEKAPIVTTVATDFHQTMQRQRGNDTSQGVVSEAYRFVEICQVLGPTAILHQPADDKLRFSGMKMRKVLLLPGPQFLLSQHL
jgi:hypothetical protein